MSLYVKLVSNWYRDPKILKAGREAREFYLASLGMAKEENSDGVIAEEQLRFLDLEGDGLPAMRERAARLVDVGLWRQVRGGWQIVAWLKHNMAKDAQLSEKRAAAGKAGADARWCLPSDSSPVDGNLPSMANGKSPEPEMANATSTVTTTLALFCSGDALAVEGGPGGEVPADPGTVQAASQPATDNDAAVEPTDGHPPGPGGDSAPPAAPGNGDAEHLEAVPDSSPQPIPGYELPESPPGQPEFNHGEFTPTDPEYQFDPAWRGDDLLALWEKRLGKLQPGQYAKAQWVLQRLHDYHRLSVRQLRAMVLHVLSDSRARRFWGTGRSPATWLDAKGSERVWQRVMADLLKTGWSLPAPQLVTPAAAVGPPRPPKPDRDHSCDCFRAAGWVSFPQRIPCPKCELGKWNAAYEVPAREEVVQ